MAAVMQEPIDEKELTYCLLIELLAYQFASPVKWVETQDVIFRQKNAKRIIEIGPSNVLGNMARRTWAASYKDADTACGIERQILSIPEDEKQICYQTDHLEPPDIMQVDSEMDSEHSRKEAASSASTVVINQESSSTVHVAPVPDVPLTATEVLHSMVALKMKKPIAELSLAMSIKDLATGKSTMQNEIVGDLEDEFGSLPESPESMSLVELGESLQTNFNGILGKQTTSHVGKMFSRKMPGGFSSSSARSYLESRWGFGPQRQQGVLLQATCEEPATRLDTADGAEKFLAAVARTYASRNGIQLGAQIADGGAGDANTPSLHIDPAALQSITKEQKRLASRQFNALADYLQVDLQAADKQALESRNARLEMQSQLDLWNLEYGELYGNGIAPLFVPGKSRSYDDTWNGVREDVLQLYYSITQGKCGLPAGLDLEKEKSHIVSRANAKTLEILRYLIRKSTSSTGGAYTVAKAVCLELLSRCEAGIGLAPTYKKSVDMTAPQTTISAEGVISYAEVPRAEDTLLEDVTHGVSDGFKDLEEQGCSATELQVKSQQAMDEWHNIWDSGLEVAGFHRTLVSAGGSSSSTLTNYSEDHITHQKSNLGAGRLPFLHLKTSHTNGWKYNKAHTDVYLRSLRSMSQLGQSFQGKTALLTGTGTGSIGALILEGLLSGGATVITTSSSLSPEAARYYQDKYLRCGGRGSQLTVMPFNQGSKQDTERLIEYIYSGHGGQDWELDFIVPFAAISEKSSEIDQIDWKSELAHRLMLTNLIRLLGCVKKQKQHKKCNTRPALVLLPLSPNHGTFGGDGLYAESKMSLETLLRKWYSESWSEYLSICGAKIGWTRGTGLMSSNDIVAAGVERKGARTFSSDEMAFYILGLMTPSIKDICEVEPVIADLSGSIESIPDLNTMIRDLRKEIIVTSETRRDLKKAHDREEQNIRGDNVGASAKGEVINIKPRANMKFEFPPLPVFNPEVTALSYMNGMLDLNKVVVITGFSELGPYGNSRTRWEMEANNKLSIEGCIEMSWIMGLIEYHNGPIKGREGPYVGWIDIKTQLPIDDADVRSTYEKQILDNSGIRFYDHESNGSPDQRVLVEVSVQDDLAPFEASREAALEFKAQHQEKVEIIPVPNSSEFMIHLKAGATIMVPRSLDYTHLVAAQIPNGWDARRYGIPEDIVSQVDRNTLYALVCAAEALLSSGVCDPYELYQYVHVSEVGNCIGSGFGGAESLRAIFKDRAFDKTVQSDILQESFINTIGAWINMLLLSSSGPLKSPVGACATAIESLDEGYETIRSGKAKVCLVGAADSYLPETTREFRNMKATVDTHNELSRGRTPEEMSRPTSSSRHGFVESEGAGIQVLMTAQLALEMGTPIHGILALTATASDKIGRSVPAPGQGILTVAREDQSRTAPRILDMSFRRENMAIQLNGAKANLESSICRLKDTKFCTRDDVKDLVRSAELTYDQHKKFILERWGLEFWKQDPSISPLRGALSTWGLSIDNLNVASLHGTSTAANDLNEADVIAKELRHLGRQKGNPIIAVCQKALTGHPKGPAGAWMLNGCLQILSTGVIPGNRNADNVDKRLEKYEEIVYPRQSMSTKGIDACLISSFGFGQKSAQAVCVHPKYLYSALDKATFDNYQKKRAVRQKKTYKHMHRALAKNTIFQAKSKPPYTVAEESQTLLSPGTRIDNSRSTESADFAIPTRPRSDPGGLERDEADNAVANIILKCSQTAAKHLGADVQEIASIGLDSKSFIAENFTQSEQAYCQATLSPRQSLAGRWSAKHAVLRALAIPEETSKFAMTDVEILDNDRTEPSVRLHDEIYSQAEKLGVESICTGISHRRACVIAVAYLKIKGRE